MQINLTRKQRVLYTFEHKKIDHLSFSPRIYYWYGRNKPYLKPGLFRKRGKPACETEIPSKFLNRSQMEIFDLLDATPRYTLEAMNIPLTSQVPLPGLFTVRPWIWKQKNGEIVAKLRTKYGTLTQITNVPGGGLSGAPKEYFIKSLDDIKIMKYIYSHSRFWVLEPLIRYAKWKLGDRGVVSQYILHSPYQRCIIDLMGFRRTTVFLKKYPTEMEDFFNFMEENDDAIYKKIAQSSIPVWNFGENIDANLTPPRIFEKYCIPYYQKRVKQLHDAGKFCHIHMDGDLKELLPYFSELPFDGLEAITPKPPGDVTLDEIKEVMGNKILLDGIPSTLFLPEYSNEYFREFTMKLIDTFSPNLILGVSDELPPNGDIRKLEMVSEIIQNYSPH